MSQYIVLSKIKIQNANSIAGFTWGFPAITQFLGFTHALSRKISSQYNGEYDTEFSGCMVVANQVDNKVYQPRAYGDFEFLQSRNPPVLEKNKNYSPSPPIIEEGKLNTTVSLVIELSQSLDLTTDEVKKLEQKINSLCHVMRIAGGSVIDIGAIKLFSATTEADKTKQLARIKRLCMPGFVLLDRSEYLAEHTTNLAKVTSDQLQPFQAWLDFSALKAVATAKLTENQNEVDERTAADWHYQKKPFDGYLVPLMTGYKAISEIYPAGQVDDVRDPDTPTRFVEAVHSVGEWFSLHRVKQLNDFIWRYYHEGDWYLCKQNSNDSKDEKLIQRLDTTDESQQLNIEDLVHSLF